MNVYDKAQELASELKNTSEVLEYTEAANRINLNPVNRQMVEDFRRKQMELHTIQMQGMQPSKEHMDSITALWNVIGLNPEIRSFIEAEMKLSKLFEDIMKILNEAINLSPGNK